MGDRKTVNKYYPPDFDPSKITKKRKSIKESAAASLQTVRLMAPFSMRCTTCGEFIYRGKKFNAKKQPTGESYLGIKIIRFYIRCPRCAGEIRFKTDPKIGDYVTEQGAERNREPWREKAEEEEDLEQRLDRLEREEIEQQEREQLRKQYGIAGAVTAKKDQNNPDADIMAELESKVLDSKREMEIQDELDAIRTRNARIEMAASGGGLLERAQEVVQSAVVGKKKLEEEEDEEAARKAFKRTSDGVIIRQARPPDDTGPSATSTSNVSSTVPIKPTVPNASLFNPTSVLKKPVKGGKKLNALGVVVKKKSLV
ncbi:Yju2p [Sugiyamaella lignohabitans]|uniref:Splicing factor YJU2 n=1 Tax=Sugiyamaella lignohabitans TaxID=796027 RepID=A0A167ETS2_9ASCO|nr:Yju2p [Sugiyamaella lignohabitans]ANB14442.1 Yju2p [Sugiyamaella lignohabitans]